MSVIDWASKPEPWRTLGLDWARKCATGEAFGTQSPPASSLERKIWAGEIVTDLRRGRRMKQATLAQVAGISEHYLSQIERGVTGAVSAEVRQRIAAALDAPVGDIWP